MGLGMSVITTHLLASGDDLPKGIVGLIIFAIWVISAIAGGIKKKNANRPDGSPPQPNALEAFQREIAQRLQGVQQQFQQQRPPVLPTAASPQLSNRQRVEAQQRRAAVGREAKRVKQIQQQQKRRKPAPPPIPVPRTAEVVADVVPIEAVKPPSARPQSPSVNAGVIAKWMTPATLRQQFIITEIFQPPLSMRE
jgi:hypothetical protein